MGDLLEGRQEKPSVTITHESWQGQVTVSVGKTLRSSKRAKFLVSSVPSGLP